MLENCLDAGATYNIGSINEGDWLDYRINMPVGGNYQFSLWAASGNSSNSIQLRTATGTVLATLQVTNTGGYQTFATFTGNVILPAGVQTLRLQVTGGYMAVNWLELSAPPGAPPLDNYALIVRDNPYNTGGGLMYEAENTFTVEFWVKPSGEHEIDAESPYGTAGTSGQKYVMYPTNGGDGYGSRAGMGVSVGTNGVSVYEHADNYMPAVLVWQRPVDTAWVHVAVVYRNGKPSLYINGEWKKDGVQSPRQHVYPNTQFPGGFYGSQTNGQVDEVRIWSVARTQQQLAANMNGELSTATSNTGLQGYWPMNEGMGAVLHDVSGAGRHIDLTGAGYSGASWTNGSYSVTTTTSSYRYAFNGKEKDQDIGEDDYDYGARIYDARLGRWLSMDPLQIKYPNLSPYNYCANNPIIFVDPDGKVIRRNPTFSSSPYNSTYENLFRTNSNYLRILSKYNNSNTYNFTLYYGDEKVLPNSQATTYTSRQVTTWRRGTVVTRSATTGGTSDSYYGETPFNKTSEVVENGKTMIVTSERSEIGKAKTLIHEALHAKLGALNLDDASESNNHNTYSRYRVEIFQAIKEYNTDNRLGLNDTELEQLSWEGVQSSNAFKNYIDGVAEKNNTTYVAEYRNWYNAVQRLAWKETKKEEKKTEEPKSESADSTMSKDSTKQN